MPTTVAVLFLQSIISNLKINTKDIAITFFGIAYVVGFAVFIPLIYSMENGKIIIWYLFGISWGTDTFAFLIGKNFGNHKFTPISPKKSIEGCIGGIIGATLVTVVYTYFMNKFFAIGYSYLSIVLLSSVLSILSQIGDLAASTIKRYVNIKDYGNILPGHGGMLDRIDSLIFIAPFLYAIFSFVM